MSLEIGRNPRISLLNTSYNLPLSSETLRLVHLAEAAGADFLTVHGRTRRQRSSEPPNFDAIKFLKEHASIPVVANGDVFSFADVERVRELTGCDGVMAAR